jgi:hypothetical protein
MWKCYGMDKPTLKQNGIEKDGLGGDSRWRELNENERKAAKYTNFNFVMPAPLTRKSISTYLNFIFSSSPCFFFGDLAQVPRSLSDLNKVRESGR